MTDLGEQLSERHMLHKGRAVVVGTGRRDLLRPVEESEPADAERERVCLVRKSRKGGHMAGAAVHVGVGTRLTYDGEVVVVEEMFGSAAGNEVLVRDGPGLRFRPSLREVLASGRAQAIATEPGPEDDDRETASVLLAQLSEEELEEVRERAAQIDEVLTGFRSGSDERSEPGEPRPRFAATMSKLERYEAKATELGMSVRTIKQWVRAFHTDREAGLVHGGPDRGNGDKGGLGRADVRWVEMALEIMAEHGKEAKPTCGKVIRAVGPRLVARYGEGEVKLPGRATAYRWLQELERRLPTFRLGSKRNRAIAARGPRLARAAIARGHEQR
ncbi:hypothetical protein [Streptomyces canus]|uniref:hypothetical protein n=1 Tax=Streptomyces canus TaxID=58343 RepID=UPI00371B847F